MKLNGKFIMIPRILFRDKNLSKTDICLLSLIISLTFKEKYCYASNEYLADAINVSVRTITASLSKLRLTNYINIKYVNKNRRIYLNKKKGLVSYSTNIEENCNDVVEENCYHNIKNKYKNNNKNNIKDFKRTIDVPKWMKDPNMCKSEPCSKEEQEELENMLKEFK